MQCATVVHKSNKMILFPLLVLLIFIYLFYTKDRRVEKLVAQFPGPPVHPIFGNIFNYFTNDLLGSYFFYFFTDHQYMTKNFTTKNILLPEKSFRKKPKFYKNVRIVILSELFLPFRDASSSSGCICQIW